MAQITTQHLTDVPAKGDVIELLGQSWVVVHVHPFKFHGKQRHEITCRKPNGRKRYHVVRYENGTHSSMVTYR